MASTAGVLWPLNDQHDVAVSRFALDLSESTETSVPHGSSHNNVGGSKTPDAKHVVFCSFPLMLSGTDAEHVTVTVSPTAPLWMIAEECREPETAIVSTC